MEVNTSQGFATPPLPVQAPSRNGQSEAPAPAGSVERSQGAIDSVLVQQQFPKNTRLRVDEASKRIVAQILDENNEVVRQVPPQELLDISARFNRLEGILFDEQG